MNPGHASPGAMAILRQNAPFRALWLSRSTSFIGDSLGTVALLLFVAGTEGTGTMVALLLLVNDFAPAFLSPFSGALSDRLDRKRLMIVSELAQGAIIGTIALFGMPLIVILALAGLRSTLGSIFQPASRSAVTDLVPERDLETANAVIGFGTHGFDLLGPLLGAILLPFIGIRGLLLADMATFLVSAGLLLRLPSLSPVRVEEERASFLREAGEGLQYLWRSPVLKVLTIGFCTVVAFSAADDVALVFLARDSLKGSESEASLLYGGAGLGLLIGFAVLVRFGSRKPAARLMILGFAISSLGNLLTGLSWAIGVAFTMQAVRGMGISLVDVGSNSLVQRVVPRGMQGRVFANLYGAIGLAAGLSYIVGGPLLDVIGPRLVLIFAGTGGLLATLFMARHLTSHSFWMPDDQGVSPQTEALPETFSRSQAPQ